MSMLFDLPSLAEPPTKNNEWYIPSKYIEAARRVMGSIDLDPASCEMANRTVKATKYYSIEDDGLSKEWAGNVWLNPPYSSTLSSSGMSGGKQQGPTSLFVTKLLDSFKSGTVVQSIVCINADTVRTWFQCFWSFLICFVSYPIQFIRPHKSSEHHFFGTVFVYLGSNEAAFISEFSQFGRIAKAIDTPRKPVHTPVSLWEVQA